MKGHRISALCTYVITCNFRRQAGLALLPTAIFVLALMPAANAQSGQPAPPPAEQPQAQAPSQSQPPAPGTTQTVSGDQPQSLAEAARQANAQKDKPKAKHVYSGDDLSSLHGTISVVGDHPSRGSGDDSNSNQESTGAASSSGNKSEAYWRDRARAIKEEIAQTDQQIADVQAEIAKQGAASFDPSSGLSQGVIIVHDRNAEVKQLEERKQGLERQLDDLADEARKAGADSGWVR